MSDENQGTAPPTDDGPTKEDAVKFPPRPHLTHEQVDAAVAARGLSSHPMSAFTRVGPKDGPHLTVSRAKRVARVYGHGLTVDHPAVRSFTDEERKERGLGGITCQLDLAVDGHLDAFGLMLDAVVMCAALKAAGHVAGNPPAQPPELVAPQPAPIYDEIFEQGVRALDADDGED